MGLFLCEACGYVENTALSHYWLRGQYGHDNRALCSSCDPEMEGHNRFERKPWDGELVLNPDVIGRFRSFKCYPDKCSHMALGDAGRYHLGAIGICKDCGVRAEVIDIGAERRELEHDAHYNPDDFEWKIPV